MLDEEAWMPGTSPGMTVPRGWTPSIGPNVDPLYPGMVRTRGPLRVATTVCSYCTVSALGWL